MNDASNPLDHLYWIDLPDDIETNLGMFHLNPSIPLPIEPAEDGKIDMDEVTWEKVTAACLLVLANQPSHEHAGYYRDFLHALRPGLDAELSEASQERINEGDWLNAENILLALRGLVPDSISGLSGIAQLYDCRSLHESKSGNNEIADNYEQAAAAAYLELLSSDEVPSDAWYNAGRFRYRIGNFLGAAEALEAFLVSSPNDEKRGEAERLVRLCRDEGQGDALYIRAYSTLKDGHIAEGTELARKFRDSRPNSWPGWFLLGWGLRLSEDWQAAREALEGAQKRGCRESDLYNELAICSRALGDYDATAEALEEALRQDPENIKILSNMAILQIEKGDRPEAVRWLQTALALNPEDPICRKLQEEIREA